MLRISLLSWLEVSGSVAGLLAIFIRGPENLWSPWGGISAPYPCATAFANALALALARPLTTLTLDHPLGHMRMLWQRRCEKRRCEKKRRHGLEEKKNILLVGPE